MTQKRGKSIDLGQAQANFEVAQRDHFAAERALAKAQEQRDKAKAVFQAADTQLKDAVRSVLG